jgi:hypothetical protein
MSSEPDKKVEEQIFAAALTLLGVLIAVVALIQPALEKVEGVSYLKSPLKLLEAGVCGLSIFAAATALVALESMRGVKVPRCVVVWFARILLVCTSAATVGFAMYS